VLKPQRQVNDVCVRHALACLDLFPLFQQRHAEGVHLFRDGIHLTETGHRLTARAIYDFLHVRSLLPTSSGIKQQAKL
jgi:lysophospholipase L1-like esterase